MANSTKSCGRCGQTKPLALFYQDRRASDGHRPYCRDCELAGRKAYYATPQGQLVRKKNNHSAHSKALRLAYAKTERGKKVIAESDRRSYKREPDKFRARATIRNDIRLGKRSPATEFPCHYCGQPATQHHHHKGYAREHWRDVVPVCRLCHDEQHAE